MIKCAVSCGFCHIYWRDPQWKTWFLVQCNVSKITKIVLATLHLLWANFQKIGLLLNKWTYFLRSKIMFNFTSTCSSKTMLHAHAQICINILHPKSLFYGRTHLYSYAVLDKVELLLKNSRKIQRPVKIRQAVGWVANFLCLGELYKNFPKWSRWSLWDLQFKRYCRISFSCKNVNVK